MSVTSINREWISLSFSLSTFVRYSASAILSMKGVYISRKKREENCAHHSHPIEVSTERSTSDDHGSLNELAFLIPVETLNFVLLMIL